MALAVGAAARDWASAPVHPEVRPHVSTHSSGFSFRALPPASYSEIEKVCDHYLAKGQGLTSGRAGRLLFDLANEIKGLVGPLRGEGERLRARVLHLEQLTRQWTEVFGCAADPIEVLRRPRVRSPLDLRDKLNELSDANAELECKLESAQLAAGLTEQGCRKAMAQREQAHRAEMQELQRAHAAQLAEMVAMLRAGAAMVQGEDGGAAGRRRGGVAEAEPRTGGTRRAW